MTDDPEVYSHTDLTAHLQNTTDPLVWARTFVLVRTSRLAEDGFDIAGDENTMVAWFANSTSSASHAATSRMDDRVRAALQSLLNEVYAGRVKDEVNGGTVPLVEHPLWRRLDRACAQAEEALEQEER